MRSIKFFISLLFAFGLIVATFVQSEAQSKEQRKSPPQELNSELGDLKISIKYGAPSVRDREIWGGLVPYDKVWRTGANEATTFTVNQDVLIEGQPLTAGTYSLYTIPSKDNWTFIFNGQTGQWGTEYSKEQDVLRVEVTPKETDEFAEMMNFKFKDKEGKGKIVLHWANLAAGLHVQPAMAK